MAELSIQRVSLTGLNPTYAAAAAGGDTFANDGSIMLHVKNGSAGSVTVTVDAITLCNHGFDHDAAPAIPAGEERMIGPFTTKRFGSVPAVSYSAAASVTVAAIGL